MIVSVYVYILCVFVLKEIIGKKKEKRKNINSLIFNLFDFFFFVKIIGQYLKTFQWNIMKFRADESLAAIAEKLNEVNINNTYYTYIYIHIHIYLININNIVFFLLSFVSFDIILGSNNN